MCYLTRARVRIPLKYACDLLKRACEFRSAPSLYKKYFQMTRFRRLLYEELTLFLSNLSALLSAAVSIELLCSANHGPEWTLRL